MFIPHARFYFKNTRAVEPKLISMQVKLSSFDDDVQDTLIDGGVSMIAAGAIGYCSKKIYKKRNK